LPPTSYSPRSTTDLGGDHQRRPSGAAPEHPKGTQPLPPPDQVEDDDSAQSPSPPRPAGNGRGGAIRSSREVPKALFGDKPRWSSSGLRPPEQRRISRTARPRSGREIWAPTPLLTGRPPETTPNLETYSGASPPPPPAGIAAGGARDRPGFSRRCLCVL
jgi:hypothetical protein